MSEKDLEKQFEDDQSKVRTQVLASISELLNYWPDVLALYEGMLRQAIDAGWEELAARAMVLNACVAGESMIIANVKSDPDS